MEERCPKCGARRTLDACAKCGLVYAKFSGINELAEAPPELKQLWRQVEERWDDRAMHALFVQQAVALRRVDYAAAQYRGKSDDAVALSNLAQLSFQLEQQLLHSASPRRDVRRRRIIGLMILALLLAFFTLLALIYSPAKA